LADAMVRAELSERLQGLGIDASRVAMQGGISRHLYLAMHTNVDMILDTFPYPGGTTTCESLWMGVPTLTLAGETMLSRQGASLLSAAGLDDWIATDPEDYVARAVAHASDLDGLSALRMGLREQMQASPLFDAQRFARNFEALMMRLARTA
jgi:predicted O-linked N-acetylglucosamine transferase (SPINDLY family)